MMRTYTFLSRVPVLQNRFTLKILAVAFVGIHIPLFAIIGYLLITHLPPETATPIAILTLLFTLIATGITLLILTKLLKPVMLAKRALNDYIEYNKEPKLPIHFKDEAGVLMADVQKSIEELRRSEEERTNILQILSHDLQSPVRTALGVTGLMKEGKSQIDDHELVSMLEESLKNQLNQLRYYLNLIKEQKLELDRDIKKSTIGIPELIKETTDELKGAFREKNIKLKVSGYQQCANIPKHSLQRVLHNVLDNAIKFSHNGDTIEIKIEKRDRLLDIIVEDSGKGFPPDEASQIFKYNSPLQRNGTANEASSGVGMFLCQNLMKRIGGEIKAESEGIDKGSKFTISYLMED
ncbi:MULTISPECIES: sensor histidine kinase [Roseivirga]|jgi:signal transduction histidine kinase|uniref:histidine kinase n=1 Tax=Roseivirga spongicola TaxID=333140 RepID=A0A150XAW3_9BACT|nr:MULTISPECIES: HAMP domain-containing sensor histidine kinase [Roseivirga]KYG75814.1 hypothetical protein AWW68_08260 [Roseivirga spongicola]MBO6662771.1 HAMP domain-containing histidine kinase [Roseivirga sp.]MBO6909851.1 HAMP domain-containing histidine kinase [Roseivirga sp.]WPZ10617.1 HAMP domain-containing sensor histidine kinase [Roseivirga spongicola]